MYKVELELKDITSGLSNEELQKEIQRLKKDVNIK